jgi:hypothetical protein
VDVLYADFSNRESRVDVAVFCIKKIVTYFVYEYIYREREEEEEDDDDDEDDEDEEEDEEEEGDDEDDEEEEDYTQSVVYGIDSSGTQANSPFTLNYLHLSKYTVRITSSSPSFIVSHFFFLFQPTSHL